MKTTISRHKLILLLLSSSLFLVLVSGFELGLSPSSLDISLDVGEKYCGSFEVFSDRETTVYVEDFWSKKNSEEIKDYTYSSDDFDIDVKYLDRLFLNKRAKSEYCVVGNNPGEYKGLLLVKDESSRVGVGMWVNLEILRTNSWITGNVISNGSFVIGGFLFFESAFLLIVLASFLFLRFRRKRLSN